MTITRLFAAAAVVALMSGAATAQTLPPLPTLPPVPPAALDEPPAMSPNPVVAPSATTAATDTAGVLPMSSQSPEVQATLKAGDANVVTNGPVPDTAANRAKYGKPMSNAGRRTAPRGN